jgi:molybdopterin-guanine dinucleotide biosynthesis protein A
VADQGVTGVLLVGGASSRFGSAKALASFRGEALAVRAHRILAEAFETVIAVGKTDDALPLPFAVHDDGSAERAAIVGLVAGLRLAGTELCVVVPTDMPLITAELLRSLVQTGPLPGAYRRSTLPVLERRIAAGELALHRALEELDTRVLEAAAEELRNVNTPADLAL